MKFASGAFLGSSTIIVTCSWQIPFTPPQRYHIRIHRLNVASGELSALSTTSFTKAFKGNTKKSDPAA
jgi:hypothetical protein